MFDDILEANADYAESFALAGIPASPKRLLAVVTCMDSRIEPLQMLGLVPGDAKIFRNAGARITDDALRTLVLGVNLFGIDRIAIIHHTNCAMTSATDDELRAKIGGLRSVDASGWDFLTIADTDAVLRADIAKVRDCPLLPDDVEVAGFLYDVDTGRLGTVVDERGAP